MKATPILPTKIRGVDGSLKGKVNGLNRRQFFAQTAALGALASLGLPPFESKVSAKGSASVSEAFDHEVEQFMGPRKVPGAALAVVQDGRLVYARGYGFGDREARQPAQPDSLFRIASISKPFTAVATLKLVAAGKLDLNAPAFDILGLKPLSTKEKTPDARLKTITVRQLLHHTGGWDRDKSGDPMFRSMEIARAAGTPAPAMQEAIIRYMLGEPLDFDPGARFAYSNFGYCVLGRIIEKITGLPYEQFVKQEALAPIGIRRMRLGASLENGRAKSEVKYYTPDAEQDDSVFPNHPGKVPVPYGGFCLEAMDSHGGWLASAVDLARFAAALDDKTRGDWLKSATKEILYEPPAPPVARKPEGSLADVFYGCGWNVRIVGGSAGGAQKANYWHNGSLPGTSTLLVRRFDGLSWAMLFNQRSNDPKLPDNAIDPALHRAADAVADWPAHDLFTKYG